MTDQRDLFPNDRRQNTGPYEQSRMMRDQLMDDMAFYPLLLEEVYRGGPMGLPMRELIAAGKRRGWWQDTVDKHFGEKMRAAWAYGLIVVPDFVGTTGTDRKRIIHPAFFEITFESKWLQGNWATLMPALMSMNFVDQGEKNT